MMDNFELKPEETKVSRSPLVWNILTVLVLLGILGVGYYYLTIFINPNSALNPFPPASLPTLYQTPTFTPTILQQPATWTPSITITPEASRTKAPTWTLLPEMVTASETQTPGITSTVSTQTITATAMPAAAVISYVPSTNFHPDNGCNWLGVGGKVLGSDGKPLINQYIQMGGTLDAKSITLLTLSSAAPKYGASGFEFVLRSDHPIASSQTLWIQLLDINFKPLTDKIYFDTYTDCARNLVMFTFTKTR